MSAATFIYWKCPDCDFDTVRPMRPGDDTLYCGLCAGDSGHNVMMRWRVATDADKPEGRDARRAPRSEV